MAAAKKKPAAKPVARKTTPAKKKPAPRKTVASIKKAKPVVKGKAVPQTIAMAPAKHTRPELETLFCQEYVVDLNGTQAYLRVKPGAKPASAKVEASRLLSKPNIQAGIAKLIAERSQSTGITAATALQTAWDILTADPRELMEYRVGCCRHCWGFKFGYQRSDAQFEADQDAFAAAQAMADEKGKAKMGEFKTKGGPGYDLRKSANPDCPECGGEGEGREVFHDTRNVSKAAASLFAGVEVTRHGRKLLTHNKDAAMDKVFRHLGLYNDKIQLTLPTAVIKDMTGRKPE